MHYPDQTRQLNQTEQSKQQNNKNLMNQRKQSEQSSQLNPKKQPGQPSQLNQRKQPEQPSQLNQKKQPEQPDQLNQRKQPAQPNQAKQTPKLNPTNQPSHEIIQINPELNMRYSQIQLDHPSYNPPHWHESIEIIYIYEGSLLSIVGDKQDKLLNNDFCIVDRNVVHATYTSENIQYLLIQIPYVFLKQYVPDMDRTRIPYVCSNAQNQIAHQVEMSSLLNKLYLLCQKYSDSNIHVYEHRNINRNNTQSTGSNTDSYNTTNYSTINNRTISSSSTGYSMINNNLTNTGSNENNTNNTEDTRPQKGYKLTYYSLLFPFLDILFRNYSTLISEEEAIHSQKYMERLACIADYVDEHYKEPITLQQGAGLLALNPEYFSRFFKKYMGVTFMDYVYAIRLKAAAHEILNTDLTIQSIMENNGFTNPKHFNKIFFEKYGVTASVFRKNQRKDNATEQL